MAATTTLSKPFSSSSSSSSSYQLPNDYKYDVFLSFRDKDTRKNFTDPLYRALKDAGIHTFIDEEIRKGEHRSSEFLKAIDGSRISLIVLSKNYASSSWCLDELLKTLECQRQSNQTVVPIFYDVSPSDVRNQSVTFEQASVEPKYRPQKYPHSLNEEKVSRYRAALQEIANTSGWNLESTADGHKAELIRNIVLYISPMKICKPFSSFSFLYSSSNQPPHDYEYDVFLSFRGEDTRKNFTDHLYYALTEAGIHTFRDDEEIRKGENLSIELLQAIEGSRISVIVFSKNYASSRWCLNELVKILRCRRHSNQLVLPVFYDVSPHNVRRQSGTFEQAFVEHEKRYFLDKEKVLRWREALHEIAGITGWNLECTADGEREREREREKGEKPTLFISVFLTFFLSKKKP